MDCLKYLGKNSLKIIFAFVCAIIFFQINNKLYAQNESPNFKYNHDDSTSLENVFVEKFYVFDSINYSPKTFQKPSLGTITYRIFIDMKPGYKLQMVYGSPQHNLQISTSTKFYNDFLANAITGFNIDPKSINVGYIAFDSWVTMGAAMRGFTGIPLAEDKSDSYSFLDKIHGFEKSDGFIKAVLPDFQIYNIDLSFFNDTANAVSFSTNNGAWVALGGVSGPTKENKVLIAQLTTDGVLTFELNVQIGTPDGKWIKFVASNPKDQEIQFDGLHKKF